MLYIGLSVVHPTLAVTQEPRLFPTSQSFHISGSVSPLLWISWTRALRVSREEGLMKGRLLPGPKASSVLRHRLLGNKVHRSQEKGLGWITQCSTLVSKPPTTLPPPVRSHSLHTPDLVGEAACWCDVFSSPIYGSPFSLGVGVGFLCPGQPQPKSQPQARGC